jgi:capsule biosynthesis phosphatase
MRICVDIDGTICENKAEGQDYYDVKPVPGAVDTLQSLKDRGYYIIIHTARGMRTYSNTEGKIIATHSKKLTDWLQKWEVPFDELLFAKPHVDYFIDDKGYRFENWADTLEFLNKEERRNV